MQCFEVSVPIVAGSFQERKRTSRKEALTMQNTLYPTDWKRRAQACVARAGYRCEDCGIAHGVLRMGKRSKSAYVVYLHAAHVNHDPHNPQAELRALCPACHMHYDRRTEHTTQQTRSLPRRRGYQAVTLERDGLRSEEHTSEL